MIFNLIKLSKKNKVYITTWRWFASLKKAVKNNRTLLKNLNFFTENGSKYNRLEKIYNFNKVEIKEIIDFLECYLRQIKYFDFWIDNKLYTFSLKRIDDEDEYRVYEHNFLNIKEFIYKNINVISMFYVVSYKKIHHKFQNISWMFGDFDLILTKKKIDKTILIKTLYLYKNIFVYWNWINDLPLFYYNKNQHRKFNIWIWDNKRILKVSDIKLKSPIDLERYLENLN